MSEKHEKSEKVPAKVTRWDPFAEFEPLERWSPFRELMGHQGRLGRLFESVLGETPRLKAFAPALDIHEDEKQYTVSVELPGGKKEDVHVEVEEGVLTIRGEKRSEREEKKEQRRWIERSYGSFTRSFTLPVNADAEHVDASFRDGVLTVVIPKTAEAKARTVSIQ